MASIPDKETFQHAWDELDFGDRRIVMRAVSRGEPLRKRTFARMAVVRARQQQTYWRWAWLLAPAVALFSIGQGWVVVVVQALLLTLAMGGFARWRFTRAARAEQANIDRLDGRIPPPPRDDSPSPGILDRLHNLLRAREP